MIKDEQRYDFSGNFFINWVGTSLFLWMFYWVLRFLDVRLGKMQIQK